MLIPAEFKANTEPTPKKVSPVSMGKKPEGDNTSVKSLVKNSYISLHHRTAVAPLSEVKSGNKCSEEDGAPTLSDGERYGSIDDDEEEERKEQEKQKVKRRMISQGDEIGAKLKSEFTKYKQELKEYNETTRELEKKYMRINSELSEMQQKHEQFVGRRSESPEMEPPSELDAEDNALQSYSASLTSMASELQKNGKGGFHSNTSFLTVLAAHNFCEEVSVQRNRHSKGRQNLSAQVETGGYGRHTRRDQENEPTSIKQMYHVLKDVINTQPDHRPKYAYNMDTGEFSKLYTTIKDLKSEQLEFRKIIRHQQDRITDYHTRCVKAQEIMKTQKHEIDKLSVNNKQLESSICHDIDSLRSKIDSKLKNVAQLPHLMREEHMKYEKVLRENCLLAEKLHALQKEASQLKIKIDELGKRKLITVNRLKAAERDLKIFKNYNTGLKTEKRRLIEELSTTKLQLDSLQAASKRQLTRHREQTEKQRRELQKRIYDLELKLNRSQNSTSSLIQERDSLIAELQTQLHTLVHNFEVSQKHIRVLRRHIYTMTTTGSAAAAGNGPSSEPNVLRTCPQSQTSSACAPRLGNPRTPKTRA